MGNAFDPVGNSLDWSAYHALSPGGRFPGDLYFSQEELAARDPGPGRDPGSANPDFMLPDWLKNSKLGFLFRQIERDQREGGLGPITDPLASGPAYFPWSGPGARFGPEGGPLHGLLDQGGDRLQDRDYGTENTLPPGQAPQNKGGGGGGNFNFQFQPYQQMQYTPSFVGWQPIQPFTQGAPPTVFTGGEPSSIRTAPPAAPPATKPPAAWKPGGKPPAGGGGGRGGGALPGGRNQPPIAASQGPPPPMQAGWVKRPDGRIIDTKSGKTVYIPPKGGAAAGGSKAGAGLSPTDRAALLRGLTDTNPQAAGPLNLGAQFREGGFRGYDPGMLDKGSPGWMRDPTTGVLNTAGFPSPTIPGQRPGESRDEYMTRLHDAGFDQESIRGSMSGWGTGGVVRTPDGRLMFQNQYDEELAATEDRNARNAAEAIRAVAGGGGLLEQLFNFGAPNTNPGGMRY